MVVSGDEESINRLFEIADKLKGRKVSRKKLQVSQAFHSPFMTPMLDSFRTLVNECFEGCNTPIDSSIAVISTVTG